MDELLVGILTQLRLKRLRAEEEKSAKRQVEKVTGSYSYSGRLSLSPGHGFPGQVHQAGHGQVLQQPQYIVILCQPQTQADRDVLKSS